MSLEIEIRSNSRQAENSLKNLLSTLDKLPPSIQTSNRQLAEFTKSLTQEAKLSNRNLSIMSKNFNDVGKSVQKTNRNLDQSIKKMSTFARTTGGMISAFFAAGGIVGINKQFVELENRVALTTGRTRALITQQQRLFAVSRRANSGLNETVNLFSSLVVNAQLGRKEAEGLTETLLKAGKVGGGSANTINGALIQLQQGLASGKLRGEELNSVLEGLPRVAQAIAKELNVGVGSLKEMAAEGRISANVVSRALRNAKADIDKEFGELRLPFFDRLAQSARILAVDINKNFRAINDIFKTVFGDKDTIGAFTNFVSDKLQDLSVFLRALQTELILIKLEFGSLSSFVGQSFGDMVSGVVNTTDRLFAATDKVKRFARSIGDIFYDLYIEVVGNSTYPDLVDGVVDYTGNFGMAVKGTKKFSGDFGAVMEAMQKTQVQKAKEFSDDLQKVMIPEDVDVADQLEKSLANANDIKIKITAQIKAAYGSITKILNTVAAYAVDSFAKLIATAFITGFALMVASGGFAGSLGMKIATGFIGAVGAYFAGFASQIDASGSTNIIAEILNNQTNVLFTIADGIGSIVSGAGGLLGGPLESIFKTIGDNMLAFAAALPILITALKKIASGAGSATNILNPLGDIGPNVSRLVGDVFQEKAVGPIIRSLQGETEQLKAELAGVKEAFRGQKLRMNQELRGMEADSAEARKLRQEISQLDEQEAKETKKLIAQIKQNQKTLAVNSQLLEGPVNRLRDAVSSAVTSFGNLGGMIGGTLGGFFGAGLFAEQAKLFGANSAETMIMTLLGAQIGQVFAGMIVQGVFQAFSAIIQLTLAGLIGPLVIRAVTPIVSALATASLGMMSRMLLVQQAIMPMIQRAHIMAIQAGAAILRAAHMAGAAASRAAIVAGGLVFQALSAVAGFIFANAAYIALAALIGGLFYYALQDDSIFQEAGRKLGLGTHKFLHETLPQLGDDIGQAFWDSIDWAKDLGQSIADAIGDGISKLNPLNWGWFSDRSDGATHKKFATGGKVTGPGTGTSDSIPAMLSNGEYVIRESVARNNMSLLETLNATGKIPRFADGGPVDANSPVWKQIAHEEGYGLRKKDPHFKSEHHAYLDTEGYPTIGYGRLLERTEMSREEFEKKYGNYTSNEPFELATALASINSTYLPLAKRFVGGEEAWAGLPQSAANAVLSMAYNLGSQGLYKFQGFQKAIKAHDFNMAGYQLLDSKAASQAYGRYTGLAKHLFALGGNTASLEDAQQRRWTDYSKAWYAQHQSRKNDPNQKGYQHVPGFATGGSVDFQPAGSNNRGVDLNSYANSFGNVATFDNFGKETLQVSDKASLIKIVKDWVASEIALDSARTGLSQDKYSIEYLEDAMDATYSPGKDQAKSGWLYKIADRLNQDFVMSPSLRIPAMTENMSWEALHDAAATTAHEVEHMRDLNRRYATFFANSNLDINTPADKTKLAKFFEDTYTNDSMLFKEATANLGLLRSFDHVLGRNGKLLTKQLGYSKVAADSQFSYLAYTGKNEAKRRFEEGKPFADGAAMLDWIVGIDGGASFDILNDLVYNKNANLKRPAFLGNTSILTDYFNGLAGMYSSEDPDGEYFYNFFKAKRGIEKLLASYAGEPIQQFATGGSVWGAGTATSDSIPAMLSNGEFVVRESVASKNRGLLEQLNNTGKIPGFATGGTVGSSTSSEGGVLAGMIDMFVSGLRDVLGDENFEKISEMASKLKETMLLGFGMGIDQSNASDTITTTSQLGEQIKKALEDSSLLDEDAFSKKLDEDADFTKRLITLNDQAAKVRAKIQKIAAENDGKMSAVPLILRNQLEVLEGDIQEQLKELINVTEEGNDKAEEIPAFLKQIADSSVDSVKGDIKGGLSSLLKGEIGLNDFGDQLLESFTGNIIDSVAGSFTEGLFTQEDGSDTGLASSLGKMFGGMTKIGFGAGGETGDAIESGLDLFKTKDAVPVKIVDSGNGPEGLLPNADDVAENFGVNEAILPKEGTGEEGEEAAGPFGNIFEKFTSKFSGILDGFSGGLGGMFDGLIGGLSGAFSSLMGMFSGGGGFDPMSLLGAVGFFNDGGMVPGGGPQPVIAHGGEMILNKRQQGHLFNQLDKNRQGGGNQTTQNINITGDISRQTKKEILTMMPTIANGVGQYNREQGR